MPQLSVSPCCRRRVRKFGKRRFQCIKCFKTFRKQKKKRGRKSLRINRQMATNYLDRKPFSFKLTKSNRESVRHRLQVSLNHYLNKNTWSEPPQGVDLIAIADGMHQVLEGQDFTVYFILLRPINFNQAWIMAPVVVPGGESAVGWMLCLQQLTPSLKERVKALVCDGDQHLIHQARLLGWLIQRCHFHLLASIKNYVSAGPLSRHQTLGKLVLTTVQRIITSTGQSDFRKLWDLVRIAKNPKLRSRLWGLIRNLEDFRTYLKYPELHLPTTSNTAESLVQIVRDLQYRARGFRTKKSFLKWLNAICMFKQTVICNGKNQPIKHV